MSGKVVEFRKPPSRLDEALNELRRTVDELGGGARVRGIMLAVLVDHDDVDTLVFWHWDKGAHAELVGVVEEAKFRLLSRLGED